MPDDTSRKTLVFGNGIGMALDSTHFSLDHAIGTVWDDDNVLETDSKELICACISGSDRPHGESDLDKLQISLFACDFLRRLNADKCHWLSDHGKLFPAAVRKFLYKTATIFHTHDFALPISFTNSLVTFIRASNSHIATLNYDSLLYKAMIQEDILRGYDGYLVDGFYSTGYHSDNMIRKYGRTFGYYLHLHGSPLFVEQDGAILKLSTNKISSCDPVVSSHIVITHVSHKTTVISASSLLMDYWNKFAQAIKESCEIIIFGYPGEDRHLNSTINNFRNGKRIKIVEWSGSGCFDGRKKFWESLFDGQGVELIQKDSILDFTDWA